MKIAKLLLPLAVSSLMVASCGDDDNTTPTTNYSTEIQSAATNYSTLVLANYQDAYDGAVTLKSKIDSFVASPSQAKFNECKAAWKAARVPYGQTEAFRFANGPIDTGDDAVEGLLNAWPMDENYVDYVQGNANAGVINNRSQALSKEFIAGLNEAGGEANISTGWHAIEFLLWGQDLSLNSAGQRPYTDYLTNNNGTASNQDRRGQYLKLVADLLVDDLGKVKAEWESNGAYLATFRAINNETMIRNIFGSLTEMSKGELAGERMNVAVTSGDQENEHSCFADNTHVDIIQNFEGMVNVYEGCYVKTNGSKVMGTSFADIAKKADAEKAAAVEAAITKARTKINAIPTPFDNAILYNKTEVEAAVSALEDLSDRWADVQAAIESKL